MITVEPGRRPGRRPGGPPSGRRLEAPGTLPDVTDLSALLADLEAEGDDLDRLLLALDAAGWATATPAVGWSLHDTVVHLHRSDEAGLAALRGEDLAPHALAVLTPRFDGDGAALLASWRSGRTALIDALRRLPAGTRVPWFGPAMGAASFASARLMESWAHGQDVADALHVRRTPTDRLRHVAELGYRTRGWSYVVAGREAPEVPVRLELLAPSGDAWAWGPADAADRVQGHALDFCLLVTQRRHRNDLVSLHAQGPAAHEWLSLAQAFAGAPTTGRAPGLLPA